jgi:chromate reductase
LSPKDPMKILAFGASTSSKSINRQLANHAAHKVSGAEVTELDLRSFDLPIYSADAEEANGIPADAHAFIDTIRAHDVVVISMAEHNGSYTAGFKNLYDWSSRVEKEVWLGKPMLLLATSPGPRGAATVIAAAEATFPRMGADLRATFSLPSFFDNFSANDGITDPNLANC